MVDWSELKGFLDKRAESKTTIYYPAAAYSLAELPDNISSGTGDLRRAPAWAVTISKVWPAFQLREARQRVNGLMDVQSAAELGDLQAAAKATVGAVMAGMRAIRPAASQRDVEAAVENACWQAGAHGASFWPWAMAGANSVLPKPFYSFARYDHLNVTMRAGDLVRLDVGCEWNHYGGDLGRTIPVSGHFTTDQREIWDIFVVAYRAGVRSLREGATVDEVFAAWSAELLRQGGAAKSALARQATKEWSKREKVPYWEIHTENLDVGSITGPMRAGTTVDFEPIAAIGGQGYYLEDMFVIRKGGAELLTSGVPYTAHEIEAELLKRP